MNKKGMRFRISMNAPAVLGFAALCVLAQGINLLTGGAANRLVFSVYRSSLTDPLTYVRLIGYVFGHADWNHLINNMMYILILGPMLEEKYGSASMIIVMVTTAIVTGIMNMVFFPNVALLGASGIVFCMILLSSITVTEQHTIPVSFIIVALLYIGRQIYEAAFVNDSISQAAHIAGGVVGSAMGFFMNSGKTKRSQR